MTAGAVSDQAARLRPEQVDPLARRLETGFAELEPADAALMNQHLLDALDAGEHDRFVIWPAQDPVALLYTAPNASAVPAGDPRGAHALAPALERSGWRVLIGDAPVTQALLRSVPPPLFRRGPRVREQRFMVLRRPQPVSAPGLRQAAVRDLEAITEFACRLHEDDLMGPPISRSGRGAVRMRMMEAMARSAVWVVERDGAPVAKVDLSLSSHRRGAQIAGVYVLPEWRNRGIAGTAVAAIAAQLVERGMPGVTLHVRADNTPALRAYEAAGFVDVAALALALR